MRHPIILCAILIAGIFTSCSGGGNNNKTNVEEPIDTVEQVKYIDIPRTHEGVTFGQSYNEVVNYFKRKGIK